MSINITDPIDMLKEIEAYLTFRLMGDNPSVPYDDMRAMKDDIVECLRKNNIYVNFSELHMNKEKQ